MRRALVRLAVLLWVLSVSSGAAFAATIPFDSLLSFGDSLSDTGSGPPTPPSYGGRFSNGPVWEEQLAGSLGIDPSHTADYAIGGAFSGTSGLQGGNVGLLSQVSQYVAAPVHPGATTLYTVWAGGNDGIALATGGGDPVTVINQVANNMASAIQQLAGAGAQYFLVPNLPNGSRFPLSALIGTGAGDPNLFSVALNAAVNAQLVSLESTLGITIYRLDTYSLVEQVVANPGAYGLTNVTQACRPSASATPCATPDTYLFWDLVHPTTKGHSLIAAAALQALPEPGVWVLVVVALASVGAVRLRRAA
jgi:phospholipase/lecithinase/hemolysin